MKDSQYYGGSAEEARDGQKSFRVLQRAIEDGFTIRHEGDTIVIILNTPPQPSEEGSNLS